MREVTAQSFKSPLAERACPHCARGRSSLRRARRGGGRRWHSDPREVRAGSTSGWTDLAAAWPGGGPLVSSNS